MPTISDIKVKYGVSQADAEGPDVARKRRQEEHGDSKFVSAAKMRGWIR